MPKKQASNGKALVKTIKQLHALFREEYPNGGWLPSAVKMAKRFDVSPMTYHKAITRMVSEHFAKSFPKKGYYVIPEHLRCRKIGLIFDSGTSSPFIGQCQCISAILDILNANHFCAQVLHGTAYDQLYELAMSHGIEGLIWFDPPKDAQATIHALDKNGEFPMVVAQLRYFEDGPIHENITVTFDRKASAIQNAKLLKHLGHTRIAYSGTGYDDAKHIGIIDAFKQAGIPIPKEHCIQTPMNQTGKLAQILKDYKITAVLSEGSTIRVDDLFNELALIPKAIRPQVLIVDFPQLPALLARSPHIKHVPQPGKQSPDIGQVAANLLMNHMLHDKKISPKSIYTSYDIAECAVRR